MRFSLALVGLSAALSSAAPRDSQCRCLPGDDCWPAASAWKKLNSTVEGRLVETVPIGSPCHDPNYDADACAELQARWTDPSLHLPSSSSIMQLFFANQSCDAFTPRQTPCVLGNYVAYAVDVGTPQHVAATLKFAREKNIRLVVRNTGHDFFGRSTGAGAVSIWTHHLKDTEVLPEYESEDYTGPALKVGAGVTGAEAVEAAHASGLAVVSGECPSVGLAGGFTQGGGHSTLSTSFGLAADQVLEYEVVTAKGEILTASPKKNSDLYWALSGGGGGTYAVVTSMTVRAYDTGNVGGAKIQFLANSTDAETYGEIVKRFHSLAPDMVDQGATITYILNGLYFQIGPFTIANCTEERVREITAPLVSALKELEIPFAAEYSSLSFRDHYDKYLGPLPWGSLASSEWQYGGRMLPRSAFTDGKTVVSSVINKLLAAGTVLVGTVGTFTPPHEVSNAVMPAWRDTLVQLQILTPWSTDPAAWPTMLALQDKMTDELIPQIKAVTPDSATYMNEADFQEPDWKNEFFKGTYEKLLKIKKKWDPENLFYILKGVGSDAWEVDNNGKMCRT